MHNCPYCDYKHEKLISLSLHFRRTHNSTSKQLCIELFHDGVEPTCRCGCGEAVKFHTVEKGFSKYCWGHASRIKNNWGHNEKAKQNSVKTRKDMASRGEIIGWCRGKDKSDPKIAAMIEKGRNTILSDPDRIRKRSENMRKNRLERLSV